MFFSAKYYLIFRCLSGAAVISVATVDKRTISSILRLILLLLLLVVVVVFLRRMVTKLGLVTKCSPKYRPPLYTWEVFGLHT